MPEDLDNEIIIHHFLKEKLGITNYEAVENNDQLNSNGSISKRYNF